MKNTIKKGLCTALTAVSLSAFVAVPSSLNAPKSNNGIINSIEADAGNQAIEQKPRFYVYITKGENYNIRKEPRFGNNVWNMKDLYADERYLYLHKQYPVYEVQKDNKGNEWVRISKNGAKHTRWVYKKRTHEVGSNHNNAKLRKELYKIETTNTDTIFIHHFYCTECDEFVKSEKTVYHKNFN